MSGEWMTPFHYTIEWIENKNCTKIEWMRWGVLSNLLTAALVMIFNCQFKIYECIILHL